MLLLVLFIDDQALNMRNALEQKAKVKKKKNKNKNKSNNNMHIREEKIIVQGKGKHG